MLRIMLLVFFSTVLGAGGVQAQESGTEQYAMEIGDIYDNSMEVIVNKGSVDDEYDLLEAELEIVLHDDDAMFSQIQLAVDDHTDEVMDMSLSVVDEDEALEKALLIALENYDRKAEVSEYYFASVAR